ncbi:hypothetical protein [Roseateles flavus]|uniref:Copper resistance protein n=1 Tax=Roseateles flavus TaxID=3149041 RepID=A0ABV0GF28_9BURK
MQLAKRLRCWMGSGLSLALLFMQLATAAYACPQLAAASAAVAMAARMPGCEGMGAGMDEDQPQLCKAHCEKDAQGRALSAVPDLQPNASAPALLMGVVTPLQPALPPLLQRMHAGAPLRPPGAPPLYLSLLILRN